MSSQYNSIVNQMTVKKRSYCQTLC